jgi:hypothetical protein
LTGLLPLPLAGEGWGGRRTAPTPAIPSHFAVVARLDRAIQ